jgi:pimeloyl-ACP methyl ester carboxylesterase
LILADTYAGWRGSFGVEIAEERFAGCVHDLSLPDDDFLARWVPQFFTPNAPRPLLDEAAAIVGDRHPQGFRLMARAVAAADTRDVLTSIDVPTLLLWGAEDARSPVSVARAMHELVPDARLEVIAGAGHVSNMERPEAFNVIVADFCLPLGERA